MAKVSLNLSQFKASGIYTLEFDASESIVLNTQTVRLIVGFSRKGPFNAPVYLPDKKTAKRIFGDIDHFLERRGSFFHRSIYTALDVGPVFALNLMPLNNDYNNGDKVPYYSFSLSSTEQNGQKDWKLYSSFYNKERFWYADQDYLLGNVNSNPVNKGKLFNIVNLGQKPTSIIVKKAKVSGFNITAREWFGTGKVPSYIDDFDFISDYFVEVIVVEGDWSNYNNLSIDTIYSEYFDNKGLKKNKYKEFLSLSDVNTIGQFVGSIIPDLSDSNGVNHSIDTIINNSIATTGIFVAINKEALENYDINANTDDNDNLSAIDVIGHNFANPDRINPDIVNFLSYKTSIKERLSFKLDDTFNEKTIIPNIGDDFSTDSIHLGKSYGYLDNILVVPKPLIADDASDSEKNSGTFNWYDYMYLRNNLINGQSLIKLNDYDRYVKVENVSEVINQENGRVYLRITYSHPLKGYEKDLTGLNFTLQNLTGNMTIILNRSDLPTSYLDAFEDPSTYPVKGQDILIENKDTKTWFYVKVKNTVLEYDIESDNNSFVLNNGIKEKVIIDVYDSEALDTLSMNKNGFKVYFKSICSIDPLDSIKIVQKPNVFKFEKGNAYIPAVPAKAEVPEVPPILGTTVITEGTPATYYEVGDVKEPAEYYAIGDIKTPAVLYKVGDVKTPAVLYTADDLVTPIIKTPELYYESDDVLPEGKSIGDVKTPAVYYKVGDVKTPAVLYTYDDLSIPIIKTNAVLYTADNLVTPIIKTPAVLYVEDDFVLKIVKDDEILYTADDLVTPIIKTPAVLYVEGDTLPDGKSIGDVKTPAVYYEVGDIKTPETYYQVGDIKTPAVYYTSSDVLPTGAQVGDLKTPAVLYVADDFVLKIEKTPEIPTIYDDVEGIPAIPAQAGVDAIEAKCSSFVAYKYSRIYDYYESGALRNGDKYYYNYTEPYYYYLSYEKSVDEDGISILKIKAYDMFENNEFSNDGLYGAFLFDIEENYIRGIQEPVDVTEDGIQIYGKADDLYDPVNIISWNSTKTKFKVKLEYNRQIEIGHYIISETKDVDGNSKYKLTKVLHKIKKYDAQLDSWSYEYEVNQPVQIIEDGGLNWVTRYYPIDDFINNYQLIHLDGFKMNDYHLPGGINKSEQLRKILEVLDPANSNLMEMLKDRDIIVFRYIVDTFDGGLDPMCGPKVQLSRLAMQRQKCLAIINPPSIKDFMNSTDPLFTDEVSRENPIPVLNTRYIADGGNLTLGPSKTFSLPDEANGAKFSGFFSPYLVVKENGKNITIPPAAHVSNLFVQKFINGTPFAIVAGPRRGVISEPNMVGLEYDFLQKDREYIEPMGINPIIKKKGVGYMIYGNQMAYQKTLSAFNNLHVRDLLITIEESIEDILANYMFQFNDSSTRLEIKTLVDKYLDSVRSNGGIYEYLVIMDNSNNPNEVIDYNMAILDIAIEPVRGIHKFVNRITVLKTGGISSGGFTVA